MTPMIENSDSPRVTAMQVVPVAGVDSMLLNLSGAHAPYFTRNIAILWDSAGHIGAGEVPGGEAIREVMEQAKPMVEGQRIAAIHQILNSLNNKFTGRDAGGRGLQTFDQRTTINAGRQF